jgi:hypothetical protein
MSRTLAAIEAGLHIQQPSLDRPTTAQVRALRAVESGDRSALDRIGTSTWRSLLANQWVGESLDGSNRPRLTAAGRAALERY